MIKKVFILLFMLVLFFNVRAYALSVGTAANSNLEVALNRALNEKKTISNTYHINKEISVYALYLPFLAYLESHNPAFEKCKVVTNPKTLNYFLSSDAGINTPFGINTYAVDLFQKKAEFGMRNKMLSQKKTKKYMLCVAGYGLIISQAFKNFNNSLQSGAGQVLSNDVYHVNNNNFYNMIAQSLYNAIISQGGRIKAEYRIIRQEIKNSQCVYYGKSLKCGGVYLNMESYTVMSFGGLDWFNPQTDFGGQNDIIEIGYNKDSETGLNLDKSLAIKHLDENSNNLTNDLLNSIF